MFLFAPADLHPSLTDGEGVARRRTRFPSTCGVYEISANGVDWAAPLHLKRAHASCHRIHHTHASGRRKKSAVAGGVASFCCDIIIIRCHGKAHDDCRLVAASPRRQAVHLRAIFQADASFCEIDLLHFFHSSILPVASKAGWQLHVVLNRTFEHKHTIANDEWTGLFPRTYVCVWISPELRSMLLFDNLDPKIGSGDDGSVVVQ
mmetsp:Transcript_5738/g.12928  ORF Transcript_5738/g.12928 Transcript_5738/m.12928 type:complete len:205 (+) Transcript_5738:126-740(+)